MAKRSDKLEKLPLPIHRKLDKTGQTRGASVGEIYQNRVNRNSTVLIPWSYWDRCKPPIEGNDGYQHGFIVLVDPTWYFGTPNADAVMAKEGVVLGENAMLLFQQRFEWDAHSVEVGNLLPNGVPFRPPTRREAPIGGSFMARIHSTTAPGTSQIDYGFNETDLRGAGIRVYEYASAKTIKATRMQLEAIFWLAEDSHEAVTASGMSSAGAEQRRDAVLNEAEAAGLLDYQRLEDLRIIDAEHLCICPLCLKRMKASEFSSRDEQAEGRETWDLTITMASLFHVEELRLGWLRHKPYNLGWGHHYCNVVVKDTGIDGTLNWMDDVLAANLAAGWKPTPLEQRRREG